MLLEDKRVKERQKKGQKWFLKRKYEEKKNTESTENNSILIQLSDFLLVLSDFPGVECTVFSKVHTRADSSKYRRIKRNG